jgi:CHASE2 domain-containing sensor protein
MVVAPGFMDPLFANPPAIAGLPAGVVFLFLALVWAVLGIVVARRARSTLGIAFTLVVFTLPALFAILVGPALILIVQNLAI